MYIFGAPIESEGPGIVSFAGARASRGLGSFCGSNSFALYHTLMSMSMSGKLYVHANVNVGVNVELKVGVNINVYS